MALAVLLAILIAAVVLALGIGWLVVLLRPRSFSLRLRLTRWARIEVEIREPQDGEG